MLRTIPRVLAVLLLSACSSDPGVGPTEGPTPSTLVAVSGTARVGWPGQRVDESLVVEARDADGAPLAGVIVTWDVVTGGGSVTIRSSASGPDGRASAEWTLGRESIQQSVEARAAGGVSVTFDGELAVTGSWDTLPDMPVPVRAAAAATDGQRIFVFGGESTDETVATTQIFDPATDTWSLGAPVPTEVVWSTAVFVAGRIHLFGGVTDREAATDAHWIYNPTTDAWAPGPALPAPAAGAASGSVGAIVVVAGGIDGPGAYSDNVHVYDANARRWSAGEPVPEPWINWRAGRAGARLLFAGGSGPGRATSRLLREYDPVLDEWTTLPQLPVRTEAMAASGAAGLFCLLGGRVTPFEGSFNTPRDRVDCFEPEGELWLDGPDLPIRLQESVAIELQGSLYVMGGWLGPVDIAANAYRLALPSG